MAANAKIVELQERLEQKTAELEAKEAEWEAKWDDMMLENLEEYP